MPPQYINDRAFYLERTMSRPAREDFEEADRYVERDVSDARPLITEAQPRARKSAPRQSRHHDFEPHGFDGVTNGVRDHMIVEDPIYRSRHPDYERPQQVSYTYAENPPQTLRRYDHAPEAVRVRREIEDEAAHRVIERHKKTIAKMKAPQAPAGFWTRETTEFIYPAGGPTQMAVDRVDLSPKGQIAEPSERRTRRDIHETAYPYARSSPPAKPLKPILRSPTPPRARRPARHRRYSDEYSDDCSSGDYDTGSRRRLAPKAEKPKSKQDNQSKTLDKVNKASWLAASVAPTFLAHMPGLGQSSRPGEIPPMQTSGLWAATVLPVGIQAMQQFFGSRKAADNDGPKGEGKSSTGKEGAAVSREGGGGGRSGGVRK